MAGGFPTAHVRLEGLFGTAPVGWSDHALERYTERVRPFNTRENAIRELAALAPFGTISATQPPWCTSNRPAPLYLHLGDVSFALAPDNTDAQRLVAITCLTRTPAKRSSQRKRSARTQQRTRDRGYRRPHPNRHRYLEEAPC